MPRLGGYKKKREFVRQLNPNFLKRERRHDSVVGEYERLKALEAAQHAALEHEKHKEKQVVDKAGKDRELTDVLTSEFENTLRGTSLTAEISEESYMLSGDSRIIIGDENRLTPYHGASGLDIATACTPNDEWLARNDWNEASQPFATSDEFASTSEKGWTQIPKRRKGTHQTVHNEKTGNDGGCFNCGGDHKKADCPEPLKSKGTCHNCNEQGHFVKNCPQISSGSKGGVSGRACYNCGEVGHFSKECPNQGSGSSKPVSCYNCNNEGHKGRDCPEAPKAARRFAGNCYNCGEIGHQSHSCPVKGTNFSSRSGSGFSNAKPKNGLEDLGYEVDFNSGFEASEVDKEPVEVAGNAVQKGEAVANNEVKSDEIW